MISVVVIIFLRVTSSSRIVVIALSFLKAGLQNCLAVRCSPAVGLSDAFTSQAIAALNMSCHKACPSHLDSVSAKTLAQPQNVAALSEFVMQMQNSQSTEPLARS